MTALLLAYRDIATARDFLVTVLGFQEEWSVTDEAGHVERSHVRLGDTVLMLDRPGSHDVRNPHDVGGVTHLIVITVDDVDEHWQRASAAGADLRERPVDRPWGREYDVTDREGYLFSFIQQPRT